MSKTSIEWCDHSINPIRARVEHEVFTVPAGSEHRVGHYCEKISPGCANCYASTLQKRFRMPAFSSSKNRGIVDVFLDESKLQEVLRRRKPTKYFWCDMTDMFGEWVKTEWIWKCWDTMAGTPQHTHQILTKRPERMASVLSELYAVSCRNPLPNVWLGTSVEDQERADERIPHLLRCPAAVRFVSAEPLIEAVDFCNIPHPLRAKGADWVRLDALSVIDWIIVGGESGHGARPFNVQWARNIIQQCKAASVPVFMKQLGANAEEWDASRRPNGTGPFISNTILDRKGGNIDEWPRDLRIRQFPPPRSTGKSVECV